MMNDNYPLGAANDPKAPYNQIEQWERDFDVCACQVLSKNVTIYSDKYVKNSEWEDGTPCYEIEDDVLKDDYMSQHLTPLQIILEFRNILHDHKEITDTKRAYLISQCEGWVEDDFAINQ